jgi:hypothetical protein
MKDIPPINYKVGDVIEPIDQRYQHIKAIVTDITERGILFKIIGSVNTGLIPHHQGHLMTKCLAGTVLYGSKDKEHSKG